MPTWLLYFSMCLMCFGLWGFFSQLALNTIPAKTTLMLQSVGILLVTLWLVKPLVFKTDLNWSGGIYGLLTGVAFALDSILFF